MSRRPSQKRLLEDVMRVLNNPTLISEIIPEKTYSRIQDDHDGTFKGILGLFFCSEMDIWLTVDEPYIPLRFRNLFGGSRNSRVYNALKILALAIKLDNEEYPQNQKG